MAFSDLTITQINLHHSKGASAVLLRRMAVAHTHISLIQEPWVVKGTIKGLGGLRTFKVPGAERPRACVAVRGIEATPLWEVSTGDLMAVRIKLGTTEMVLASVYLPIDGDISPPADLDRVLDYCQNRNIPLIAGCDANAHHEVWGSTDTNNRGDSLLEYLVTTDLDILNTGNAPTFRNAIRAEVIDITLCTRNWVNRAKGWKVCKEPSLSDHYQIEFVITVPAPKARPSTRNPRRANWAGFAAVLEENMKGFTDEIKNIVELEDAAEALKNNLRTAFEENCPLKEIRGKPLTPWWNDNLERLKRNTKSLHAKAVRTNSDSHWQSFRKTRDEYRDAIRTAKTKGWRTFCNEIKKGSEAARLDKILAKNPEAILGSLRMQNGEFSETDEQTLGCLVEAHFPGFHVDKGDLGSEISSLDPPNEHRTAKKEDWKLAKEIVTPDRMRWAIKSFDPYKSPGPDGIYPALLQRAGEMLIGPMTRIARASLALGHVPRAWTESRVVFIPKAGRASYVSTKDFRPISLTSFFLKTIERLVDRYVRDGPLKTKPLSNSQHAYQAGLSTETALKTAVSFVGEQLGAGGFAVGTFIDIEGAFNNTSRGAIGAALKRHGVPQCVNKWIEHMLASRTLEASKGEATTRGKVTSGCPQGGVLSPLLWNLVVNELIEEIEKRGHKVVGYADDLLIIIRGPFLDTLMNITQSVLKVIESWCEKTGLSVNPKKTEIMVFTKRYKWDRNCPLVLNGQKLEFAREVKYLGVTLDGKLSWKTHLERRCRGLMAALWLLRRAIGSSWGLRPSVMMWIYETILKPRLTYAAVVWWSRTTITTAKAALERLRGTILRAATGAARSTPTAALGVLLGVGPLHNVIAVQAAKSNYRLKRTKGLIINKRKWPKGLAEGGVLEMPSDRTPRSYLFDKKYKITLSTKEEWESDKARLPSSREIWYTDGSKIGDLAGTGVYQRKGSKGTFVPLGRYATITQAELMGIAIAAQLACLEETVERVYICSDSLAALSALKNYTTESKQVLECHNLLNRLAEKRSVEILWVPGHKGIRGNEIADDLARLGARETLMGPEPAVGITYAQIKAHLDRRNKELNREAWIEAEGCRQSRTFIREDQLEQWPEKMLQLNRQEIKTLVGIITGHAEVNYHKHNTGRTSDPDCRFCGEEEETVLHILCDCEALVGRRSKILGEPIIEEPHFNTDSTKGLLLFWKEVFG